MSEALIALPVGYVPFHVLSTEATALPELEAGRSYWVKRSDFHAISNEGRDPRQIAGRNPREARRFSRARREGSAAAGSYRRRYL